MEKVIDKSQAYEAYRLAWDDIAKLLSDQIKAVLGRRFLLRVWPEDQGYWGARALHGLFSVADLNRLLDAVQADAETRMETLPEDSEAVHGFGMTLGSLLLKAALQADWKCEMVEDDALWLIGFVSSETRPYTVSGLLRTLNPDTLMSAKEILTYLKDNDSTDRTLSDIRLRYYAAHGNELCWRYPICDGIHAGAFILATKDGYLSLPYNSIFLKENRCMVHAAKPRTCRIYPFVAGTGDDGQPEYLVSREKEHHFKGPAVHVKAWMKRRFTEEDKAFLRMDLGSARDIARLMRRIPEFHRQQAMLLFWRYKYSDFDLDQPFLKQYAKNLQQLKAALSLLAEQP